MKLSDFYSKYTKEEVKAHFMNYISDTDWEQKKDKFMFYFVIGKEKETPRSFINDNIHLLELDKIEKDDERAYQEWRVFSSAISNYPLGDKLLQEYGDKLEWSSISYRKDLTLEFYEKHKDKIKIKDIKANLGPEFIEANLMDFDPDNVKKFPLNYEQAQKLIKANKLKLDDFWNQSFFTKEFSLKNIIELKRFTRRLDDRFKFNYEEKLQILKDLENANFDQNEWNSIISSFMESGELNLTQKKEIKWLAWI